MIQSNISMLLSLLIADSSISKGAHAENIFSAPDYIIVDKNKMCIDPNPPDIMDVNDLAINLREIYIDSILKYYDDVQSQFVCLNRLQNDFHAKITKTFPEYQKIYDEYQKQK